GHICRHLPVDAYRRQRQRSERERTQQQRVEPRPHQRLIQHLRQRTHQRQRQARRHLSHRREQGIPQRIHLQVAPHQEGQRERPQLPPRHVEGRPLRREAQVPGVLHHPHHLEPPRLVTINGAYTLPDRRLTRPRTRREALAHHRHVRHVLPVLLRYRTARTQTNLQ